MSKEKLLKRKRRALKTRARLNQNGSPRITVIRSNANIRAQLIVVEGKQHNVVAEASSLEKDIRNENINKSEVAKLVGKNLAERAIKAGYTKVSFDRSGFKYHGRIKALADAAREGGMQF